MTASHKGLLPGKLIGQYNRMPLQARAGAWIVLCNILVRAIGFLTVPLFARLLPAAEYGDASVFLSGTEMVLILTGWDVSYGVYQKGLYKYQDEVFFTKASQAFTVVCTVIVFLILTALYPVIGSWTAVPLELYPFMFLYLCTQPSYRNWMAKKQKEYDYKRVAAVSLLHVLAVTAVPLTAVIMFGRSANIKYASQMLASFAVFVIFFLKNADFRVLRSDKERFKEQTRFIIAFQLPCVAHSLSLIILSQADRIMIRNLVGSEEAAFYGAAYSFASLLLVVQGALDQAMIPWRYELMAKKDYKTLNAVSSMALFLMGVMSLAFMTAAPEVIKIFLPEEYYEAAACIPPISVSVYFVFLYTLFASLEAYFEYTRMIMYVSTVCSLLNIVLNYVGIGRFGYTACAYTTLISYICFCFGHCFGMRWVCRKVGVPQGILNIKQITVLSGLILLASMAVSAIYENMAARYAVFLLLVCVLIINRKYVYQRWADLKK